MTWWVSVLLFWLAFLCGFIAGSAWGNACATRRFYDQIAEKHKP